VETKELPHGVEHFLSYLKLRMIYDRQSGGFAMDEMRVLNDGMKLYVSLEHRVLLEAWKIGSTTEDKIRARFEPQTRQTSIHGYLLEYDYPIWSMKYRRAVL